MKARAMIFFKVMIINNLFINRVELIIDIQGGKVNEKTMAEFMKEIKKKSDLTDKEAAQIAASKIADSKPKSRMYYKIGASRAMAGSKRQI